MKWMKNKKKELERKKEIIRLLHVLNMDNIFIGFEEEPRNSGVFCLWVNFL